MPLIFSYIGDIDEPPFQWDDPDDARYRTGNLPSRVVPAQTGGSLAVSISSVMRLAEQGAYEGRQIDWGAWGLRMTGAQLQTFLAKPNGFEAEIDALDPEKFYVLVAAEGP